MNALSDLFPRARAEIFRLLFVGENQEMHLRDLARHAALSVSAVHKELTYLASKEIVTTRVDGNRLYYRANVSHPLYPELCGIACKTNGIATEISRALNAVEGVEAAWIFGSVAAGTAKSQSDVDLLVIGNVGLRKITPALRKVAENLNREINPICLSAAEWCDKLERGDAFAIRVEKEPKIWLKGGPRELAAMAV